MINATIVSEKAFWRQAEHPWLVKYQNQMGIGILITSVNGIIFNITQYTRGKYLDIWRFHCLHFGYLFCMNLNTIWSIKCTIAKINRWIMRCWQRFMSLDQALFTHEFDEIFIYIIINLQVQRQILKNVALTMEINGMWSVCWWPTTICWLSLYVHLSPCKQQRLMQMHRQI